MSYIAYKRSTFVLSTFFTYCGNKLLIYIYIYIHYIYIYYIYIIIYIYIYIIYIYTFALIFFAKFQGMLAYHYHSFLLYGSVDHDTFVISILLYQWFLNLLYNLVYFKRKGVLLIHVKYIFCVCVVWLMLMPHFLNRSDCRPNYVTLKCLPWI